MSHRKIILWIFTSTRVCPSVDNSTFQLSMAFVVKFKTLSNILNISDILLSNFVWRHSYQDGGWKCRSTKEMSVVFFLAVSFWIQWVKIPTPNLGSRIAQRPEPNLSFWDGTGFSILHRGAEFFRIFNKIPLHSISRKCLVISCFFVPFSAGNFMFT